MKRSKFGILLAISSLPGRHGIGDFGIHAYEFIDWLSTHNYSYWQILPLNPLGPGNSPYMTTCSEAIDPRYISLDLLIDEHLLSDVPSFNEQSSKVEYQKVNEYKELYLAKAFEEYKKLGKLDEFNKFKSENDFWVYNYALFICLRRKNNNNPWNTWSYEDQNYDLLAPFPHGHVDECEFYMWTQYIAFKQWNSIRKYAKKKYIYIVADCPFYVGLDSLDVYRNRKLFLLDENNKPTLVGGCPPDAFTEDGQLWGNPIYNFMEMYHHNHYGLLKNRIGYLANMCDYLRIDHFRAFDTYFVIPSEDKTARNGKWWDGPSYDFFDDLFASYPNIHIIVEDLGELFPSVHKLRDHYKLPGMFIVQFTIFNKQDKSNSSKIVYPGTHDNDTIVGFIHSLSRKQKDVLIKKFNSEDLYKSLLDYTCKLKSKMTIIPLQDILSLGNIARMNTPGTVDSPNWEWKLKDMKWMKKIKYEVK